MELKFISTPIFFTILCILLLSPSSSVASQPIKVCGCASFPFWYLKSIDGTDDEAYNQHALLELLSQYPNMVWKYDSTNQWNLTGYYNDILITFMEEARITNYEVRFFHYKNWSDYSASVYHTAIVGDCDMAFCPLYHFMRFIRDEEVEYIKAH